MTDLGQDWSVELCEEIRDLLPGFALTVKQVGVDRFAIRVRYEIRPPVTSNQPEHAEATAAWFLHATDSTGHRYQEGGGAFGISPDGSFTEGVRSLQPAPAKEVEFIDLEFISPHDLDDPRRVLRVQVPHHRT